jgi:hypothetical protein
MMSNRNNRKEKEKEKKGEKENQLPPSLAHSATHPSPLFFSLSPARPSALLPPRGPTRRGPAPIPRPPPAPRQRCNTPGVTMARAHIGTKDCELYVVEA